MGRERVKGMEMRDEAVSIRGYSRLLLGRESDSGCPPASPRAPFPNNSAAFDGSAQAWTAEVSPVHKACEPLLAWPDRQEGVGYFHPLARGIAICHSTSLPISHLSPADA